MIERLHIYVPTVLGGGIAEGMGYSMEPFGPSASGFGRFGMGLTLFGVESDNLHQIRADVSHKPNVAFLALLANLGESL